MIKKAALFCLAVLLGLQASYAEGLFNPKTFTLKNGLQVVVITNNRSPVVKHTLWYKVGGLDDPIGQGGIAHFLEHLMFKGAEGEAAKAYSQIINNIGGKQNAATGHDFTFYYATVGKEHLETVMQLESKRMQGLSLREEDVETERGVILEERSFRVGNNPQRKLVEAMFNALNWNTLYRRPVIGWKHEIKLLSRENIMKFYKRFYAPNNAILMLTGDITIEEAKPLVEKYYGPLKPSPNIARANILDEPPHHNVNTTISLKDEQVTHPAFFSLFAAPTYKENPKIAIALQIVRFVLSQGAPSILYQELKEKQNRASWITTSYDTGRRAGNMFMLAGQPASGVTLEELQNEAMAIIKSLLKDGLTDEQIASAKRRYLASLAYVKDSSFAGDDEIGETLVLDMKIEDVETWPQQIDAVTRDDIIAAIRMVFDTDEIITGILLPKDDNDHATS
ncbi:MAG: M16 family metallopeptidase [Alphaproteobacteria bacterium]